MSDSSTPPPPDSDRLSPAELRRLVVGKVRRIPGVPPAERDDVAQEATLRAWRSLPTYDKARGSFLDWLGAVVLNTARDIMRLIRRRPETACDELPELATDCEAGPEAQVGAAEVIALARRIADEIPADLRRVLLMKAEGLTTPQIAARLRLPETTVQGRLARAQHHAEQTVERWKAARRLKPHDLIALALLWMVLSGEPSAEAAMVNPRPPHRGHNRPIRPRTPPVVAAGWRSWTGERT